MDSIWLFVGSLVAVLVFVFVVNIWQDHREARARKGRRDDGN
jgi:hypothetical protein